MENKQNKDLNQDKPMGTLPRNHKAPSLTIDYARYWHYLENSNLTDEQKRELLDNLGLVVTSFVGLGFDIHVLPQGSEECEQLELQAEFLPDKTSDMVDCDQHSSSQFNNASDRQPDQSLEPTRQRSQK